MLVMRGEASNEKKLQTSLILREAKACLLGTLASCGLRLCLEFLVWLDSGGKSLSTRGASWMSGLLIPLSLLARCILYLLPSKASKGTSPGFVFSSIWVLLPIKTRVGVLPHLPSRLCEAVLGRITWTNFAVVLPVHFLSASAMALLVNTLLPECLAPSAVEPISYSQEDHWITGFLKEMYITALFVVGLFVLPELTKINRIPLGHMWLVPLCLYPVYSYGVDGSGTASIFSPNVLYALQSVRNHKEVPLAETSHMLGPLVGGLVAGKIMNVFFPDAPAQ